MSTLKKYAYGLLLTTIGLINFGYCDKVSSLVETTSFNGNIYSSYTSIANLSSDLIGKSVCFKIKSNGASYSYIQIGFRSVDNGDVSNPIYIYPTTENVYFCLGANIYLRAKIVGGANGTAIEGDYFSLDGLLDENLPVLTSLQCQTEYNLIPISSVDQNYCVNNGLCPSGGGECTGTGNNWSALYINNIQYNGAPTIRVTIPEEIERDNYTDEEETTIDIIGYGYDQEKMQQMVNTQYYKPTAEEMSGLMEKVADFLPLVAVALLITRLRRVIKKIF